MEWLVNLLITALGVWLGAVILPGVQIRSLGTALWVAILLAIVNATVGAILRFLTLPINFLTLGLASFIITVLMIMLVDKIVRGFHVRNFGWGALLAMIMSVFTFVAHIIV
jgi:putative membrane protein